MEMLVGPTADRISYARKTGAIDLVEVDGYVSPVMKDRVLALRDKDGDISVIISGDANLRLIQLEIERVLKLETHRGEPVRAQSDLD